MKNGYFLPCFRWLLLVALGGMPMLSAAQLGADLTTTDNTNCFGVPCDYNGPSILINELMMSPNSNDGSMWGSNDSQRGEWIELYNPNICESIDISCFYLGNNANDSDPYAGGYVIPPGTVIPPAGFAMIRGLNAPEVPAAQLIENGGNVFELIVDGTGVCIDGGNRLWFPNSGGWFAFYDNNGVPQDAVSWASQSNVDEYPCVPSLTGCGFSGTLSNYTNFPNARKNYILNQSAANFQGQSIRRIPDGGTWSGPGTPTFANCNDDCIDPTVSCGGTALATVLPVGGTPPYTYLWDDPQNQTTQFADNLCAGTYCVTITDALNNTTVECITVENATYDVYIEANICESEDYSLPNNTVVTAAGEYPVLLQTGNGCDSTVTVNLTVHPHYAIALNPEICAGDTYTLPDGAEVTAAGSYQVDYQSIYGCDSIYTVNLTVNPLIEVTLDAEICAGDSYELPDGTPVTAEGAYEVTVPGGPASCDTVFTINLAYFPDFTIGFDLLTNISCFGETDGSLALDISGPGSPFTYVWSDGVDHGSQASTLQAGNYSVEVSSVNGCKADTTFQIIEPSQVSLVASADNLVCFGSSSQLVATATGGTGEFNYHWSHSSSTDSLLTENPTENTSYIVNASDENGCETDSVTLNVAVINMYDDSLEVSVADSICFGSSAIIYANYSGQYPPYTYSWNHELPNEPGSFIVSPEVTTTYTVTVSDNCGNEVSKNIEIVVWSLPVAVIDTIANISCFGASDGSAGISITDGTPNYSFEWSDGQDHGDNPENLSPGNYEVEITDANGCKTSAAFGISEPVLLTISLAGDTLTCPGEEVELLASTQGGTPEISYHWNHMTADSASVVVSPLVSTSYSVFAEDANGCTTDTLNIDITIISMDAGLLSVSNDTAFCPGGDAEIYGNYSGNFPPYTYSWTPNLPEGHGPFTVSPDSSTVYSLTVEDLCENTLSANVEVNLHESPVVQLPDQLIAGCSPLEVNLLDSAYTQPGYTHEWIFSNAGTFIGNPVNLVLEDAGVYQVLLRITSPEGCSAMSETSFPVEVYPSPTASFSASAWTTGINEPEITFTDLSIGSVFSTWTVENTQFENQSELTYTFADTGFYSVQLMVENEFGCRDSISRKVNITIDHTIEIPNAFTPGGGGDPYYDPTSTSNTIFYPFSEYAVDYQMSVFNRWGELIFESNEIAKGWNGTYRDEPCPQDVYVYKIDLVYADGKKATRVGDVTLFR